MLEQPKVRTPWQKAYAKFGLNRSALAREMGRDRSKISRHIRDEKGLISGPDQERLFAIAKRLGVDLKPEDVVPEA